MCAAQAAQGAMHVATTRRHYTARDGTRHEYEAHLLRRSFRDAQGKSQKETLANLSQLPAARVRGHILICMLSAYVTWHLRKALAPLTFTGECIPERQDPVSPARRPSPPQSRSRPGKPAASCQS